MPRMMPMLSAKQSLMSAPRLKLGWMSSLKPPKALAPKNTRSNQKRPVLASGKESAAKAIRCRSLSLPLGAGIRLFKGQSVATVEMRVTTRVIGMSRYLRIIEGYCPKRWNTTNVDKKEELLKKFKVVVYQSCVESDGGATSGRWLNIEYDW